jgi:hypothetical protein
MKELKLLTPKKPPKPQTFLLHPGQCLWLDGLARIEYTEGDITKPVLFTAFVSNEVSDFVAPAPAVLQPIPNTRRVARQ